MNLERPFRTETNSRERSEYNAGPHFTAVQLPRPDARKTPAGTLVPFLLYTCQIYVRCYPQTHTLFFPPSSLSFSRLLLRFRETRRWRVFSLSPFSCGFLMAFDHSGKDFIVLEKGIGVGKRDLKSLKSH
ncbi:hypothetical protein NPIL_210191 [Nephila pilipes]|uniref:Uncharacterized protein n=1 Tax=Nephila pilipes TaxID=299642 RepID=A0A8X6PEW2_NEPPI|nr:hypothetical protein NPIL_210191 [Nephila pilipes]